MAVRRDLSTRENREYWKFIEKVAKEAEKIPKYLKGGESQRQSIPTTKKRKNKKQT